MRVNEAVIVTHAFLSGDKDIPGPAHTLSYYFQERKIPYLFIRHALFREGQTLVARFDGHSLIDLRTRFKIFHWEPFLRLIEGFLTIIFFHRLMSSKKPIFIGIDPLNALWGLILKKIGKVDKLIVFTADYSDKKYPNRLYNFFYHRLDRLIIRNCDLLMAVSKRIVDLRKKQGVPPEKLVRVPNSPLLSRVESLVKKKANPLKLITIATLSKAVDFSLLFEAVKKLKKKFPGIKLTIIGTGPAERELKREIKKQRIKKNVVFMGAMSHQAVFKVLARQGIGVALYNDKASWTFYSDSMKARDFLAMGLPVVISGDLETAAEIQAYKAGFWIKRQKEALIKAIAKLIGDEKLYINCRRHAFKLAQDNDVDKILTQAFSKL